MINGKPQEIKTLAEKSIQQQEEKDKKEGIVARLTKVATVGHTYEDSKEGRQAYRKEVHDRSKKHDGLALCERMDSSWVTVARKASHKLAKALKSYPEYRILCPDSGATANMNPHRDMFIEYEDIKHEGRYVRLGDENKKILIHGIGTMAMVIEGKTIAYRDAYHVPQLSAILLSTRVHRRVTKGCEFICNHDGCFLTYPNFVIEIDDECDCTIRCSKVSNKVDPLDYNFDSRRWLAVDSSKEAIRQCDHLAFKAMARSRMRAALQTIGKTTSNPEEIDTTDGNDRASGHPKQKQSTVANGNDDVSEGANNSPTVDLSNDDGSPDEVEENLFPEPPVYSIHCTIDQWLLRLPHLDY